MPLRGVTYWQAVCDACGEDLSDNGEFSAWSEPDGALDIAGDRGSRICVQPNSNEHLIVCPDCNLGYMAQFTDDDAWDYTDEALDADDPNAVTALARWARDRLASSREDSPS